MKNLNVPVLFQTIKDFNVEDTRFTKVKIWLMHLDENLNGTSFTQEAVMDAIPTLAYTPIMGMIEDGDFLGHEQELVIEDDDYRLKTLTQAYGVIPEFNNAQFEDRVGDDGVTRTYLTVDGLLWNKWEEAIDAINSKQGKTGQSMEIIVQAYTVPDENGVIGIERFQFDGACLLGDAVKPAMVSSNVELAFSDKVDKTIKEKLAVYAKSLEEGGNELELDKLKEDKDKFEEVDPEVPEPVEPEVPEPEPEPEVPVPEPEPEPEITTEQEVIQENTVPFEKERKETEELLEGEEEVEVEGVDGFDTVTYTITLHDGEEHSREETSRETTPPVTEVTLVGIGTEETILKETTIAEARKNRKEVEDRVAPVGERIVVGENVYTVEEATTLITEYQELKKELHEASVDSLFDKYSAELTEEDMKVLKEDAYSKDIETLETLIFATIGKNKFSKQNKENSSVSFSAVSVTTETNSEDPYNGVLNKYLSK